MSDENFQPVRDTAGESLVFLSRLPLHGPPAERLCELAPIGDEDAAVDVFSLPGFVDGIAQAVKCIPLLPYSLIFVVERPPVCVHPVESLHIRVEIGLPELVGLDHGRAYRLVLLAPDRVRHPLQFCTFGIEPGFPATLLFIDSLDPVRPLFYFAAGFVPGILMGLALMIVVSRISKKRNYTMSEGFSGKKVAVEFKSSIWALLAPVIILGGILGGIFTPTEAAAVAVIYSFFVGKFIFREIAWKDLPGILFQSGITTGAILLIISLANVFAWVIAANQIPVKLSALFLSATSNPYVFLLIVNILLLIVGMFMETGAAIILLAPILAPIAVKLGVHPLHFGFMMVLNLAIGMATPPVGVCLFVSCGITGLSLEKVSAAAMRFVFALLGVLLLVTYVAPISLFLPKLLGFIR
jgi:hypothetical protein